ncbi:MAG: aldehyde dehydrogenase family protein [Ignavibacteria bacterium]|jgi:NAD-dependent aldehyde dehydrogenases|nr:MAG: aldehyde dehydrogenase [Chlorobi bacterium OLB4]
MYKLFIGGKFTRTESERYFEVFEKQNGNKICNVSRASRKDLRNAVESALAGYKAWGSLTAYNRAQIIYRLSEMLEGRKEQFTDEIKSVTGKSNQNCNREVQAAIDRIIFYAGLADKWTQLHGTVNPVQDGYFNFSIPEPMGIVGIIVPENNSPLLSFLSFVLPVLTAGNAVVAITDHKISLPILTLAEVIATSDFPASSVNILTGNNAELYKHLAGHYGVNSILNSDKTLDEKTFVELSANNVKRVYFIQPEDLYNNEKFENYRLVNKFAETKTVWHTVGN